MRKMQKEGRFLKKMPCTCLDQVPGQPWPPPHTAAAGKGGAARGNPAGTVETRGQKKSPLRNSQSKACALPLQEPVLSNPQTMAATHAGLIKHLPFFPCDFSEFEGNCILKKQTQHQLPRQLLDTISVSPLATQ